jgi:hypothetical protein
MNKIPSNITISNCQIPYFIRFSVHPYQTIGKILLKIGQYIPTMCPMCPMCPKY